MPCVAINGVGNHRTDEVAVVIYIELVTRAEIMTLCCFGGLVDDKVQLVDTVCSGGGSVLIFVRLRLIACCMAQRFGLVVVRTI